MARGLVTAQQMATMSPVERHYLFNQLRPALTGQAPAAEPGRSEEHTSELQSH